MRPRSDKNWFLVHQLKINKPSQRAISHDLSLLTCTLPLAKGKEYGKKCANTKEEQNQRGMGKSYSLEGY